MDFEQGYGTQLQVQVDKEDQTQRSRGEGAFLSDGECKFTQAGSR